MSSTLTIGYCFCGSFCTLALSMKTLKALAEKGYNMHPIMSEITYSTDTRFGDCLDFRRQAEEICGRPVLHTIPEVEPIGPTGYLDALVIAPCTGNSLGKLANGIYDSSVTNKIILCGAVQPAGLYLSSIVQPHSHRPLFYIGNLLVLHNSSWRR